MHHLLQTLDGTCSGGCCKHFDPIITKVLPSQHPQILTLLLAAMYSDDQDAKLKIKVWRQALKPCVSALKRRLLHKQYLIGSTSTANYSCGGVNNNDQASLGSLQNIDTVKVTYAAWGRCNWIDAEAIHPPGGVRVSRSFTSQTEPMPKKFRTIAACSDKEKLPRLKCTLRSQQMEERRKAESMRCSTAMFFISKSFSKTTEGNRIWPPT